MKRPVPSIAQLLAITPLCLLAACGGGSGSPAATADTQTTGSTSPNQTSAPAPAPNSAPAPAPSPAPGPIPISGTVATGAPLAGAAITMTDATGTVVATATSSPTGTFTITPAANAVPPYVMTAVAPSATLVAFVPNINTPVANITSVSNLAASLLSSNGAPTQLAIDVTNSPSILSASAIQAVENQITTLLQPLSTAVGVSSVNLLYTAFSADGTGADLLLDSLNITIRPAGAAADIQVTVREALADGAAPQALNFSSASPPTSVSYTVSAGDLAPSGLSAQIQTLLGNATACYAQDVTTRIVSGVPSGTCAALFYQSTPANYLNSGSKVKATGSFADMFSASGNGEVFSEPIYLYSHLITLPGASSPSYEPVIRFKTTTSTGAYSYSETTVAEVNGAVTFVGDQYIYSGGVAGLGQLREYVNAPTENYIATGVSVNVNNTTSGGNPIFSKVIASSALGTYTYMPTSSLGYLVVVLPSSTLSTSAIVRLSDAYVSSSSQPNPPSHYEQSLYFASPVYTDAQIAAVDDQTAWELDYYLTGSTSPAAIQYYRTEERPLTLAEFNAYTPNLPAITSPTVAALVTATMGTAPKQYILPPTTGSYGVGWSTPADTLSVDRVELYGNYASTTFNDLSNVLPGVTTASISCVPATNSDTHCNSGNWSSGANFYGIQFITHDAGGQELESYFFISSLY